MLPLQALPTHFCAPSTEEPPLLGGHRVGVGKEQPACPLEGIADVDSCKAKSSIGSSSSQQVLQLQSSSLNM